MITYCLQQCVYIHIYIIYIYIHYIYIYIYSYIYICVCKNPNDATHLSINVYSWKISDCVAKLHLFPKGVQGDAELLRSLAEFFWLWRHVDHVDTVYNCTCGYTYIYIRIYIYICTTWIHYMIVNLYIFYVWYHMVTKKRCGNVVSCTAGLFGLPQALRQGVQLLLHLFSQNPKVHPLSREWMGMGEWDDCY